jgi:NAD(P)-dependent dehydrogenase (short-subunit alcohol dehydrogenase family)
MLRYNNHQNLFFLSALSDQQFPETVPPSTKRFQRYKILFKAIHAMISAGEGRKTAFLRLLLLWTAVWSTTPASAWLLIPTKKQAIRVNAYHIKKLLRRKRSAPLKTAGTAAVIGGGGAAPALWNWQQQPPQLQSLFTPQEGSLRGKTIVITGASTGLGLESAKRLACGGANLILTARNQTKGESAVNAVYQYLERNGLTMNQTVEQQQTVSFKVLDFDNLTSVQEAVANDWEDVNTIDVLLNNAGLMALPQRECTVDGFERQIQSNHLGHFVLTSLLSKKFASNARTINLSSSAHKQASSGLQFDYMWKADTGYSPWKSYGQSKLCNIYFTRELQRRINKAGLQWQTASVHPGVVATDLWRYNSIPLVAPLQGIIEQLTSRVLKTPEQGATTQIWLAAGEGGDIGGKFFADRKAWVLDDFATNLATGIRLWKDSEELTGIEFSVGQD